MGCGKLDSYMQKNQTGLLAHTMHKNQYKMDYRIKYKPETIKLLEENTGRTHFESTYWMGEDICKLYIW